MDWKSILKPGTICSGLAIFITLLVDSEGAAARIAAMAPKLSAFLSAFMPLIAVGGTAFFSVAAVMWSWHSATSAIQHRAERRQEKRRAEVGFVLELMELVRNRTQDGEYCRIGVGLSESEMREDEEETKLAMAQIREWGLAPPLNSRPERWHMHLSGLIPHVRVKGVREAVAERNRWYAEKKK